MPFNEIERAECERLLMSGLAEDLREAGDITSQAIIPADADASAVVVARQLGFVAGLPALELLAGQVAGGLHVSLLREDGPVEAGTACARLEGSLRSILKTERLALNLLGRLSGVATLTAVYARAVAGTKAKICDTRKTTPGWRNLEKYAVRIGGGTNHRLGLFDAVLIKDNHLAALSESHERPIAVAVQRCRERFPDVAVEVEVDSLIQLEQALAAGPDWVLLDNMTVENLTLAVEIRGLKAPSVRLEASGGIKLENVAAIAQTGVDRISVGALTHSAAALDLALDYESAQ